MASVSTYLNFKGNTLQAFEFYRDVFETEFEAPIQFMKDVPASPDGPQLSPEELEMVMHVSLPITGGHVLMGTDIIESMSSDFVVGTNVSINLQPDTRIEAERLFKLLSDGGKVQMPLTDMFWGDYFGACTDTFGVCWMVNCSEKVGQ